MLNVVSYLAEEIAVGEKILQEIPLLAKVIESCGDDARNFSNIVHHVCAFIHIYLGTDIVFLDQRNINGARGTELSSLKKMSHKLILFSPCLRPLIEINGEDSTRGWHNPECAYMLVRLQEKFLSDPAHVSF